MASDNHHNHHHHRHPLLFVVVAGILLWLGTTQLPVPVPSAFLGRLAVPVETTATTETTTTTTMDEMKKKYGDETKEGMMDPKMDDETEDETEDEAPTTMDEPKKHDEREEGMMDDETEDELSSSLETLSWAKTTTATMKTLRGGGGGTAQEEWGGGDAKSLPRSLQVERATAGRPGMGRGAAGGAGSTASARRTGRRGGMQTCAPLSCAAPVLRLASVAQALADPESQSYHSVVSNNNSVCKASFPTVLILAGLKSCANSISSVKFQWTRPDGTKYSWVENWWPYTVFSDTYPLGFASRALGVGTHKLEYTIRRSSNNCVARQDTVQFVVRSVPCPAGTDRVRTRPPTKRPTKSPTKFPTKSPTKAPTKFPTKPPTKSPTKAPTKSPTKPPTKSPTMSPTKLPTDAPTFAADAAFCHSLEYFQGHLYGFVPTQRSWNDQQLHLQTLPKCCGGVRPHLATITSTEEAYMLRSFSIGITKFGNPYEAETWIGLRLLEDENGIGVGPPVWTTGENVTLFAAPKVRRDRGNCFYFSYEYSRFSFIAGDCEGLNYPALYEYDCQQPVVNPNVTYQSIVPDNDEFCSNLTYHEGHLYWHYRTGSTNPYKVSNALPYDRNGQPCCGGKWPHLVTIGDEAENIFVRRLVNLGDPILLGLSDLRRESVYEWITGENVSYMNWRLPNDLPYYYHPLLEDYYDCVLMLDDGTWETWPCTEFISMRLPASAVYEWDCEIPIPEPRNTLPPVPPTSPPSKPPTKFPTQKPLALVKPTFVPTVTHQPTLVPRSAFCKSLTYHNGHLYGFDSTPRSWDDSRTFLRGLETCCNGKAPHLVTISDEVENGVVQRLASSTPDVWIGLSDTTAPFDYRWVTNETVSFYAYGVYGPGFDTDCTSMQPYSAFWNTFGRWEDKACSTLLPMVFEYDCDEGVDGRIPLPRSTLQPTAAPTFCQSLTEYKGHLYGAYSDRNVNWMADDLMAPFVRPEVGITECCGKKAHLATAELEGEMNVLSTLQQQSGGTNLWWGLNDRHEPGRYQWIDTDVEKWFSPVEYKVPYEGLSLRVPVLSLNDPRLPFYRREYAHCSTFATAPLYSSSVGTRVPCNGILSGRYDGGGILFEYDCDTEPICTSQYESFGGHLYGVIGSGFRFFDSYLRIPGLDFPCCGAKGKLVSIESPEENAFVAGLLQEAYPGQGTWLSLHDLRVEGQLEWGVSGVALTNASYANWAPGEPNNGGPYWFANEDCVRMDGATGLWSDVDCYTSQLSVVEFDCVP